MAALLVAMSVMAVFMSMALPVWETAARREKEAELVFRGEQYARAIALYQRKFANALPPSVDVLVNDHYLRKKYLDPITGKEFQLLSGASAQANLGVPGGQVGSAATPGGRVTAPTPSSSTSAVPGSGMGSTSSGSTSAGLTQLARQTGGLGAGVGANGIMPGGIMGVTSTSTQKSLRLYNGRGVYNEWTFVAVQRNLNAGAGAAGSQTPGAGRGTAGRGNQPTGGRGTTPPPGGFSNRPLPSGFGPPGGGFGTPNPPGGGFGR